MPHVHKLEDWILQRERKHTSWFLQLNRAGRLILVDVKASHKAIAISVILALE